MYRELRRVKKGWRMFWTGREAGQGSTQVRERGGQGDMYERRCERIVVKN